MNRVISVICILAGFCWSDRMLLAQDQDSAASPSLEPAEVKALIDRADQALGTKAPDVSAILSDPGYLSVHPWPRFRDLIKAHATGSSITIVTPQEPGKRLRVRMRLVEADGSAAVSALVYFYHTDAAGEYGPNVAHVPLGSDNNYARLFGFAVTDSNGTIEIQTIRPGGYPNSTPPEHIHVRIWCRDKRSFGAEIWFADDPRINADARQEAARFPEIVICPVAIDTEGRTSIDARIKLD